jgi:hypothetical protein
MVWVRGVSRTQEFVNLNQRRINMPSEDVMGRLEALRLAVEFLKHDEDADYHDVTLAAHSFYRFIMPEKKDETA